VFGRSEPGVAYAGVVMAWGVRLRPVFRGWEPLGLSRVFMPVCMRGFAARSFAPVPRALRSCGPGRLAFSLARPAPARCHGCAR
jgi:hypothetical protein